MDLEVEYNHLLETVSNEKIFDVLDARREARQQKEGVENC